jgi:hypothetical protein
MLEEPLYISFTSLVEGWGFYISYHEDEKETDGVAPTLRDALQKILTLIDPKLRIVEDHQYDIDTSGWTPKE